MAVNIGSTPSLVPNLPDGEVRVTRPILRQGDTMAGGSLVEVVPVNDPTVKLPDSGAPAIIGANVMPVRKGANIVMQAKPVAPTNPGGGEVQPITAPVDTAPKLAVEPPATDYSKVIQAVAVLAVAWIAFRLLVKG